MSIFIGRTPAYYDDDDGSVFTPDYWTWTDNPDDGSIVDEIHELTPEGIDKLNWWMECRRMNEYQRHNCFPPYRYVSPEEMWSKLTEDNDYSHKYIA